MNSPTRKPDEVAGHSEPASELPVRLAEAQRGLDDALAEQELATDSLRKTIKQFGAAMSSLGLRVKQDVI